MVVAKNKVEEHIFIEQSLLRYALLVVVVVEEVDDDDVDAEDIHNFLFHC